MFDMLDVYGPSEILQFIGASYRTDIVYLAETLDPVTTRPAFASMNSLNSSVYPSLTPTHTFETAPKLDVLIIPGGPGWRNPTGLNATMAYIRETAPKVQQVLTICTCSSGWYIAREEGHSQQVFMVEHGGGQPKYDVGAFCPMGKKLPVQTKCVSQSVCI
jgi:hypothetical protein